MKNLRRQKIIYRFMALVLVTNCILAVSPALAQVAAVPYELPGPPEKQPETPTTCGPLITDTCIPIEEKHSTLQVTGTLSFVRANFTPDWRQVNAHGNFYTFNIPVKYTYGPMKNLETYIVVPFIANKCNSLDASIAGPNGERGAGYSGIGDITTIAKYLVLEEGKIRPAVSLVGGVGWPSGHANHLNPTLLGQDAVGTGSFNFISGVNLSKWVNAFCLYGNIWLNSPVNMFRLRGEDTPQAVRNRENVTFNLAAEYVINGQWVLLTEMYSTWAWNNPGTESLGFQSPTTLLGFMPGIEYIYNDKWSATAGCAFDAIGKYGSAKITPALSVYYNF